MIPSLVPRHGRRHACRGPVTALAAGALLLAAVGCGRVAPPHPAVGRQVGPLPLEPLAGDERPAPAFSGRVTLLNFWGTWCPPCRLELPGLARIAVSLAGEPCFQFVAVSCGPGGPDDREEIAADTARFLERGRIPIDAWCDPSGMARRLFADGYGFDAFPTTYLIGPDARVRRVWSGYRSRDEAEIAAAVVAALKECAAPPPAAPGTAPPPPADPPPP